MNGDVFHSVQRAVYRNQTNGGVDKLPSIAEKVFEKKIQERFFEFFPRTKSTQATGSVYADRIELVKNSNF